MKTLKVDRRKTVVPEDTDILFDEQIQMWIRPAANDIRALRFLHEYKELGVKAGETVLDAGGNIGGFVRWVMAFAPALVVTVEPDAMNFKLLELNTKQFIDSGQLIAMQAAISHEKEATLYLNNFKGKDSHSTVPSKGRTEVRVPGVRLDSLLDQYRPARVKLDIEGEELAWLPSFIFPDFILGLSVEIHLQKTGARTVGQRICENIARQGFAMVRPYRDTGQNWNTTATWRRD